MRTKNYCYNAWYWMMRRCYDNNHTMFRYYGGRGVQVEARWHDYETFKADMGQPPHGYTLERINPNKNYGPKNCKWTSWFRQRRSRTDNNYLILGGHKYIEADWCLALGFKKGGSVSRRLKRGWNLRKSLTTSSSGEKVPLTKVVATIKTNIKNEAFVCRKTKTIKVRGVNVS